ncbi:histone-like nucleoid-structuring protein Lsr2 [Streptomyces sp. NPDC101112]|uniref:Lsr2 family DNA-binding protein n=1 Tax=Streptomyces sp. NPDC101112 TaxID=3366105 RepID=UPI00380B255F
MTITALRALLDEIDTQGGPEAARQWRLAIPDPPTERTSPVDTHPTTQPPAATAAVDDPERMPVGKLLAWADAHQDPDVQDQSARARAAITGLRRRYATDHELAAITTEAEQLEQRLAELRAREAELAPANTKRARKPVAYPAAEVRAWAKENGHDCPAVGRVPKPIVEAWRAATNTPASETP